MKNILKLTLAAVALLVISCASNVSAQKLGYIASNELLQAMPETAQVQTSLMELEKELGTIFDSKRVEYNKKADDYQNSLSTMSEGIRKTKLAELEKLGAELESFATEAETTLTDEQRTLMEPIVKRATEAIETVAKAQGVTVVFDLAYPSIVYYDKANMVDLLPLVKQQLGIK